MNVTHVTVLLGFEWKTVRLIFFGVKYFFINFDLEP